HFEMGVAQQASCADEGAGRQRSLEVGFVHGVEVGIVLQVGGEDLHPHQIVHGVAGLLQNLLDVVQDDFRADLGVGRRLAGVGVAPVGRARYIERVALLDRGGVGGAGRAREMPGWRGKGEPRQGAKSDGGEKERFHAGPHCKVTRDHCRTVALPQAALRCPKGPFAGNNATGLANRPDHRMRAFKVLAVISCLLAASGPAIAQSKLDGWGQFKFGMTPDEARGVPGVSWKPGAKTATVTAMESLPMTSEYGPDTHVALAFNPDQKLREIRLFFTDMQSATDCEKAFQKTLTSFGAKYGAFAGSAKDDWSVPGDAG